MKKAFTLVEIIVVVAIIAILMAIVLPILSSAKESAYHSYSLNNLRQLGIGQSIYTEDYGKVAYGAPQLVSAGLVPTSILNNPLDSSPNGATNVFLVQMSSQLSKYKIFETKYKNSYLGLRETGLPLVSTQY